MTIESLVKETDKKLKQLAEDSRRGEPEEDLLRRYRTDFINRYIDFIDSIYKD